MTPSEKLRQLGLSLPQVAAPIGVYVPALRVGDLVYTSGQIPFKDGKVAWTGKVPRDLTVEAARDAARQSALNALAAVVTICGDLNNIVQIIRVCVFVNSADGFSEHPKVANGASELYGELFGDRGRHVRAAVGAAELPMNAAVELELIARIG